MEHESLNVNIELTAISGAQIQTAQDGTLALIIPINSVSDLSPYTDRNGRQRVYLPLTLWPKRNVGENGLDQYGYSHDVQQSYTQAKRAQLPAGVYPPSIGRAKPIMRRSSGVSMATPPAPPVGYVPVNPPTPTQPQHPNNDGDALPF